ncbi:MAG: hypothetical protein AAB697_02060 [Patescibacteria group bacterium]
MMDRIKQALPKHDELWPLLGSFGLAIASRAPLALVNGTVTVLLAERLKENELLLSLGLLGFALFNLLYMTYDYAILKKDSVSSSAKANTIYRTMKLLLPNSHEFNTVVAELGATTLNVVGINPDLSAPLSTIASITTGDISYAVAQRISDMVIGGAATLTYAMYLKRRNAK